MPVGLPTLTVIVQLPENECGEDSASEAAKPNDGVERPVRGGRHCRCQHVVLCSLSRPVSS